MQKLKRLSKITATLGLCALSFTGCKNRISDDPISALNGLVQEYGFIGYENPLENSGAGVMLAGRPNALAYIAPAEDCFSSDAIARNYDTQHFNKSYSYKFQGNLGFSVFGTSLFSAGLDLTKDLMVNVELNGITIEYLSSIDITDYYRNGMRDVCKEYLDDVGFVIQALITDSMKISITKVDGTNIGLSADNIYQYIGFKTGVNWEIIDEYTVEVTTPKYIGYQLGRLRLEDGGRTLYRATVAEEDKFIFEPLALFEDEDDMELTQAQKFTSELDSNAVYLD